jgi:hypothetical protein
VRFPNAGAAENAPYAATVLRIHDKLSRTLIPFAVVAHAMAPLGRDAAWRLTELDGVGEISRLHPEGLLDLQRRIERKPQAVTWDWLESLARLLDDTWDLEVVGQSPDGTALLIRCFDSAYWEIEATDDVEHAVKARFESVEVV